MGTIKITKDTLGVYEVGSKHDVWDVYSDFCATINDATLKDYLARIPIPEAISEIAFARGFEYKFV